ncbi:MAG TPA: alanine racemase [Gemmatimonadales bacterium]|nr:alanine racemase [Gemmatimonadales bacterium]
MTTTISCETARAWVDVDLGALAANAKTVAAIAGGRLLPMVKANGYGLGAIPVVQALEPLEPWGYGVASTVEAAELRAGGIARPIVLFTPLLPAWIDRCLALDVRPAIGDLEALRAWTARSERPFHLEIDTGMSRAGFRYDDPALRDAAGALLDAAPGWEGAFTHFHSPGCESATELQWARLCAALTTLPRRPALVHAANSAAAVRGRRYTADLVRPGIFLYGGGETTPSPRPVAAFRARVVALRRVAAGATVSYGGDWRAERPTTIATVAAGYADGVVRAEGRPRHIELNGRRVPVVGRVAMDMIMVALADDHAVSLGDIATIWGGLVSLDEQARATGTISYELLTALGPRVPRRYAPEPPR